MKTVTISFTLADYKQKDNTRALEMRVTFGSERDYYATGHKVTKEDFAILVDKKKVPERLKEAKERMIFMDSRAEQIRSELEKFNGFTFQAFRKKFLNKYGSDDIFPAFDYKIKELKADGKIKTAKGYETAKSSIQKFRKKVRFADITVQFLKEYERWLLSKGATEERKNTYTTLGIYLRNLRHILNKAVDDGLMQRDQYPFGRNGYKIISGRNLKKACTLSEISAIMKFKPRVEAEERAKDFWLLSYFCNGINFKDLLLLKNSNLQEDYIVFTRAKTAHKDQEKIQVFISGPVRQLLNKYSIRNVNKEALLFPIVTDAQDLEKSLREREQFIKTTNHHMGKIAKALNIDKPITTYYARHSYATVLKRQGVSIEQISEALGHGDTKTTRSYLDSFETDIIKKNAELLIPKLGLEI